MVGQAASARDLQGPTRGKNWTRFNLAEEHNKRIAEKNLTFDMQVVNASDPHAGRALPEPETSSYTGLAEAPDGAMVVSYDRLANGWKQRTWNGTVLEPGCWGDEDVLFTMRVFLVGCRSVILNFSEAGGRVSFSRDGRFLFFSNNDSKIGRIDLTAGTIQSWCQAPGACTALFVDRDDNLLLSTNTTLHRISKESNEVELVAGGGPAGNDATAEAAGFTHIKDMTVDSSMNILVLDQHCIRKVTQAGVVSTVCGGNERGHVDGRDITAKFYDPNSIAYSEQDGSLFIADFSNHRIRRVDADFKVSTCAGDGQAQSKDGCGTAASVHNPRHLVCVSGWVYFVENTKVRCVSPQGQVTTVAGSPDAGYVDALGERARFKCNHRICTDERGLFVIADGQAGNDSLRMFRADQVSLEKVPPSTLSSELAALVDDDENTDLTVIAEGKPIHSLRGLLTKRSDYFKNMLGSGMREGQSDSIDVAGSYEAVRAVLMYLHTDELNVADEHAVEVLQKAEEWCLPRLKAMGAALLMESLSPTNAPNFFVEAEKYGAEHLSEQCMAYMVTHFGAVKTAGQLDALSKEQLLDLIQRT
eukprot:g1005.t1